MKIRLTVLLAMLALGCGATNGGVRFGDPPPLPAPPPEVPSHASTPEIGVSTLISDSISQLALDGPQRGKLDAILADIKQRHRAALDARAALAIDMARSVQTALVDDRLLALDGKNLASARAELSAGDGHALEDLHQALGPEQRKKFAAGLRLKADQLRLDDFASRYGVWRNDTGITPEQDARIEPKLKADSKSASSARAEREAWQGRLRATATAFEADTFSSAVFTDPDTAATTIARIGRLITFLQLVVPELTQEQLERAAKFIRAEAGVSVQ